MRQITSVRTTLYKSHGRLSENHFLPISCCILPLHFEALPIYRCKAVHLLAQTTNSWLHIPLKIKGFILTSEVVLVLFLNLYSVITLPFKEIFKFAILFVCSIRRPLEELVHTQETITDHILVQEELDIFCEQHNFFHL